MNTKKLVLGSLVGILLASFGVNKLMSDPAIDSNTLTTSLNECQVSELRQISSNSTPFKEWASDFQCGETKSSILIVDADPANIYLFTYTVNTSTPNMMKKLQEMVKICYKKGEKDSDCYSISSH